MATVTADFHQFSKLPTELRLRVWKFTLPGPRIVSVHMKKTEMKITKPKGGDRKALTIRFLSGAPQPPAIMVCQESRYEALKEYEPAFGTQHSPASIYVNWDLDTIIFPYTQYMPVVAKAPDGNGNFRKFKGVLHKEWEKIKFFAFYEEHVRFKLMVQKCDFPSLEKLIILIPNEGTPWMCPSSYMAKKAPWTKTERIRPDGIKEYNQLDKDVHRRIFHSGGLCAEDHMYWRYVMDERAEVTEQECVNIVYGSLIKYEQKGLDE